MSVCYTILYCIMPAWRPRQAARRSAPLQVIITIISSSIIVIVIIINTCIYIYIYIHTYIHNTYIYIYMCVYIYIYMSSLCQFIILDNIASCQPGGPARLLDEARLYKSS